MNNQRIVIKILVEDRVGVCPNEHGLSVYFEYDNKKVLLDTGASDLFINNAKLLNVDLSQIDTFVLSHGHYDHGMHVNLLPNNITFVTHPDSFKYRLSKRTGKYAGINQKIEAIKNRYNLVLSKGNHKITEKITYLGEIPRLLDFEATMFPTINEDGTEDIVKDDTAVVINSPKGLIILSPCSHSGICNIIEYSKAITKINNIYAVIGGFHMKEVDENTEKVIDYFKKNQVENIFLGHCTSDEICNEFIKQLSNYSNVMVMYSGLIFDFDI
jgi:7,8-dihydropterin-6-yl-methyl-4-(beta-D-ribofuranosyl)aminobenzene 5'-phosphate synthase